MPLKFISTTAIARPVLWQRITQCTKRIPVTIRLRTDIQILVSHWDSIGGRIQRFTIQITAFEIRRFATTIRIETTTTTIAGEITRDAIVRSARLIPLATNLGFQMLSLVSQMGG